jgi:chemotaxis protein CheC
MTTSLDDSDHDMLVEAASVAAGKSAKPISNLIGHIVRIYPPKLTLENMEKISDSMGEPEDYKTAVLIRVEGEAKGAIIFMVNPEEVKNLLTPVAGGLELSALEEMVNIMAGSSLGGLSKLLGIMFMQTVPANATDMLRAVVNETVAELGSSEAEILCFTTILAIEDLGMTATLYMLFDSETTSKILDAEKKLVLKEQNGSAD